MSEADLNAERTARMGKTIADYDDHADALDSLVDLQKEDITSELEVLAPLPRIYHSYNKGNVCSPMNDE